MDLAVFESIASRIDAAWAARGYDEQELAAIASEVFEREDATLRSKLGDARELLAWAMTAPWGHQVGDNEYGHPTIALARTKKLRVEIIFWMGGVTAVHGHTMPGLFYVVHGERLHARYEFERRETSPRGFMLGDLRITELELLGPGALRRIEPDDGTIHALVFFGAPNSPCVTLSVRGLNNTPRHFENDHVFVVDAEARVTEKRLMRAFLLFMRLHPSETLSMALKLLERQDADVVFAHKLLHAVWVHAEDDHEALLAHVHERFGGWIDRLTASTDRWRARTVIEDLLADPLVERGPRMLLGLAWLDPDPKLVLDFLSRAFPGEEPLAVVDRWMVTLRGPRTPQQELSAALGIAPEDDLSALLRRFRKRLGRARPPREEEAAPPA